MNTPLYIYIADQLGLVIVEDYSDNYEVYRRLVMDDSLRYACIASYQIVTWHEHPR